MTGVSEHAPGAGAPAAVGEAPAVGKAPATHAEPPADAATPTPAAPPSAGGREPGAEQAGREAPADTATPTPAAPPSAGGREPGDEQAGREPPAEHALAVVPRWVQLVVLPLALLAIWTLAEAAGKVLVIFIVASLIALILNPAVAFIQRGRVPRGLAVLAVYVAFFLILTGIGVLLANPISNQVRTFTDNLPHIVDEANKQLASLQRTLDKHGIHLSLVKPGKTALQSIQDKVAKSAGKLASSFGGLLTEAASAIFDLVLVFVLSVYMLVYGQSVGKLVRRAMPDGDGTRADDYPTLVQRAVSRYVGGQLLFSFVMGASTGLSLYVFGVLGIFPDGRKYALAFALFYGVMELVPYVGPFLGALPPVIVALLTDPITAVWVTLLFVGLQQLEGHVVAPQVFGHTLRINPLLVIFALLLGLQLHGIIGALIALPILAVLRETAVYLGRHLTLEPWTRSGNGLL
ncbi:MAG TPA: AI-2E family transporter [Solirubrobacteraceae bacterium]|nr:AI-2E family transporter [Solirubrobacteraceae bacterium]